MSLLPLSAWRRLRVHVLGEVSAVWCDSRDRKRTARDSRAALRAGRRQQLQKRGLSARVMSSWHGERPGARTLRKSWLLSGRVSRGGGGAMAPLPVGGASGMLWSPMLPDGHPPCAAATSALCAATAHAESIDPAKGGRSEALRSTVALLAPSHQRRLTMRR